MLNKLSVFSVVLIVLAGQIQCSELFSESSNELNLIDSTLDKPTINAVVKKSLNSDLNSENSSTSLVTLTGKDQEIQLQSVFDILESKIIKGEADKFDQFSLIIGGDYLENKNLVKTYNVMKKMKSSGTLFNLISNDSGKVIDLNENFMKMLSKMLNDYIKITSDSDKKAFVKDVLDKLAKKNVSLLMNVFDAKKDEKKSVLFGDCDIKTFLIGNESEIVETEKVNKVVVNESTDEERAVGFEKLTGKIGQLEGEDEFIQGKGSDPVSSGTITTNNSFSPVFIAACAVCAMVSGSLAGFYLFNKQDEAVDL